GCAARAGSQPGMGIADRPAAGAAREHYDAAPRRAAGRGRPAGRAARPARERLFAMGRSAGVTAMTQKPRLEITYCTQCNWLLRAAWMAQEVLSTFSVEMGAVTLIPGTGGVFEIRLDG